ncbi:MAG: FAD binding domain-containing protein [Nitrososphaerales archaeon]
MSSNNEVPKFGILKPTSVADAVSMLSQYGPQARILSGGTDLLSQMKNGITALTPKYTVDISGLGLDTLTFSQSDGLRIGATTTVSTIASDPNVNQYFAALAQAAITVASPQIRNQATAAGDISQEVWCWYLRNNYDCWRNGGNVCYGAVGDNRYYHTIFGGRECYAVHAGDTTTAYFAMNADVTIVGPNGQTNMPISQFMPGISIVDGRVKENILYPNEIITEIHVPTPKSNTKSAFYKVRNRQSIDFALASAAAQLTFNGSTISEAHLVLGAVANTPHRATSAESYLVGNQLTASVIAEAAAKAVEGAQPLTEGTGNAFRVFLAQGAVTKALESLS